MKQKNPLYLVKGKTVHPTQGLWDYVVLKFNLRPLILMLEKLVRFIVEQVKDYPTLVFARNFIKEMSEQLHLLKAYARF